MHYVPGEFTLGGVYFSPLLIASFLGMLAAGMTVMLLDRYRLRDSSIYPPMILHLLPRISATFEWIRLAQPVPVLVHLLEVPDDVKLLVGTTASVVVMTGTHGDESKEPVPAAPWALQ